MSPVSYDVHVYAPRSVDADELAGVVAEIEALHLGDAEATRDGWVVMRGARGRYSFTVDGPTRLEPEDVPPEVSALLLDATHVVEVTVEGSAVAEIPYALRFARALAGRVDGVVVDQQTGQVRYRGQSRRVPAPARDARIETLNLHWYATRTVAGTVNVAERYLDVCRRLLPEASPRRFGEYEPLQGKLQVAGEDGFVEAWEAATSLLFMAGRPPVIGGALGAGPGEPYPTAVWHMSLNLHARPMVEDVRWRRAVQRFFVAVADALLATYASAEITRGAIWTGRSTVYDANCPAPGSVDGL